MASLAGAAFADSTPPLSLASVASQQTPANPGAVPPDLSSQPNPAPFALPRLPESPFGADASAPASATTPPGPWGFLDLQGQNLLGNMGGLRPALAKYGVTLTILENVETFGNLSGGVKQGLEANGLTTVTVQLDTQKAFGLNGGLFNVSGLQIWGGNLSADNLDNLQTVTGIEDPVGIRLWELWYQQEFGDKLDLKIGEQSLDQEFFVSQSASHFINTVWGWPMLPTADLLVSPEFPVAGLGIRARAKVTDAVTLLAGVFNGRPIPKNSPNTPASNPHGVSFPLNTGVFAIAELQFTFPGSGASTKTNGEGPLPGTYKIGAWYDSDSFNDLQDDNQGVPLASPTSNGMPATHHGNYSIYAIADQMIWRSKDPNRNVNLFVRPMFTTLQGRNLISFSVDGGLTLHEPLPGRDNDVFGLGFGVARVSNSASGFDRQMQFFQPSVYTPIRSSETFIEATYQFQALPSWVIQPDVQYFINPGLGIANPGEPTQRIKNEFVVGLRTNLNF
jgi:porin